MEKILVVDDEQGLRDVLSIMLKRAGYAVTLASDGEEAIAHLQKELFDLVITDLKMPKVGGAGGIEGREGDVARNGGLDDYGVRVGGFCGRGHEARRLRLPDEAISGR